MRSYYYQLLAGICFRHFVVSLFPSFDEIPGQRKIPLFILVLFFFGVRSRPFLMGNEYEAQNVIPPILSA